jgi:predicted glycogen debranching enzyme
MDWQHAYEAEEKRQTELLAKSELRHEPAWLHRLVLAADQFSVDCPLEKEDTAGEASEAASRRETIVISYPWCGEQARDTLIALPGLSRATSRPEMAASVLQAAARSVDQGMVSDRFCESTSYEESPVYGTADAALWLFPALHRYLAWTNDRNLLNELYPALMAIIEWHQKGTRYGIGADPEDGLLRIEAAAAGLTWMSALYGDTPVTPRIGKPVEINALWHNALATLVDFSEELDQTEGATVWREMAVQVAERFEARYWYEAGRYLYDVIDGPDGDDSALRPNQILAVSLPNSPLQDQKKAQAVVDTVAQYLHTSYGLRTLSPHDPAYVRRYGGNQFVRATARHQGTVWAWLIGPYVSAHLRVYGDQAKARSFLRPYADQLTDHGVGSISEMFDGNSPHTARGCIASALSVSQVLCGWLACGS